MGYQKKTGKGRIDKWYRLAKEKGYRARAAFKLIQLNRKYGFLERSRVLLDLCAAPGSWCQVAAENMPTKNSMIIGVDLAPIKPIARTITLQSDITTDKCRASIRQHLKNWKVDTVLHDGAPNVGTAWLQDAFSQAELVLQALKLATEFLIEGGVFVTKIFRSKDYNALLWVFNQLFTKVEATKPPSSRNVSAEIFVVCQGFKAPKRIDPKFLDPRTVFAELTDPTPNNEAKVFNPEKKKRKREGYIEGDYIQFRETAASDFIQTTDPIAMLGSHNCLSFIQAGNGDVALAALNKLPETTTEIRNCCKDLKVLGRKDFKLLLRWRLKVRDIFGLSEKKDGTDMIDAGDEVAEITPMDDELRIQEELHDLSAKDASRKKRERRRENEKKSREIRRMQMNMTTPAEIGLDQEGLAGTDAIFRLKELDRAGVVDKVAKGKMMVRTQREPEQEVEASESDDEDGDNLEDELDVLYEQYEERKAQQSARYRAKKARTEHDDEFEGFSDQDQQTSDDELEPDESDSDDNENIPTKSTILSQSQADEASSQFGLSKRAALFFDQDIFKEIRSLDIDEENDSAVDLNSGNDESDESRNKLSEQYIEQGVGPRVREGEVSLFETSLPIRPVDTGVAEAEDPIKPDEDAEDTDDEKSKSQASTSDGQVSDAGFEMVKSTATDWEAAGEPQKNGRPDIDIITAEAMTMAHQIALGQTTTHDLVDDGFNKYTFRDTDGLPEWFMDDEHKHSKPNRPISAAAAAAIKDKLRALNARPIKKVREAKDRKKFRAAQKLEKLRKKSALLVEDEGISEKDKAANIAKMMKRAVKKRPKLQPKLVVAKGGNRGISGRPRGVKGKYKIVDARLKKDTRAEKRLAKKKKK